MNNGQARRRGCRHVNATNERSILMVLKRIMRREKNQRRRCRCPKYIQWRASRPGSCKSRCEGVSRLRGIARIDLPAFVTSSCSNSGRAGPERCSKGSHAPDQSKSATQAAKLGAARHITADRPADVGARNGFLRAPRSTLRRGRACFLNPLTHSDDQARLSAIGNELGRRLFRPNAG